jgi:hypothetical protein
MNIQDFRKIMTVSPLVLLCLFTTGCASITGTNSQNVTVEARKDGNIINGAHCVLSNNKGTWSTTTPNSVIVLKSNKTLRATCSKTGYPSGTSIVDSSVNGGMVGNIIFGGGIGAVIDHNKGTAYDYPSHIKVDLGTSKHLGKKAT